MHKRTLPTILLTTIAIGVVAVAVYFYPTFSKKAPTAQVPAPQGIKTPAGSPEFSWEYEESVRDSIPYTKVILSALYPDKTIVKKDVDAIAGGCNEYEPADAGVYEDSTMIICYYAGLGHYYKVVEANREYLVQRKVFEEASPEYSPPPQEFETIARF